MTIESSWLQIATAGQTADGRTISEKWINDMADTYSVSEYAALLWFQHNRDYGDDGQVLALRAETDGKGRRVLFAKLKPSQFLQNLSRRRTLFGSIEPSKKNFAGSGKHYLLGLGITDEPASVGTDQMLFSKKSDHSNKTGNWEQLDFSVEDDQHKKPHWFKKWLKKSDSTSSDDREFSKYHTNGDEEQMDKKQFKQFMKAQAKQHSQLMDQFKAQPKGAKADGENDRAADKYNALEKQNKKLAKQAKKFKKQNKAFAKKFSKLKKTPKSSTQIEDEFDTNDNAAKDGIL